MNSISLLFMRLFFKNKITYVTDRLKPRTTEKTFPFVSGHAFREISNHIIDDTRIPLYPRHVKRGDVIFLKTKYIRRFAKYMHPQIRERYILIMHFGDEEAPGEHQALLEDDKLIHWFGMNATLEHPKLTPIPIGLGGTLHKEYIMELENKSVAKQRLLYLNFTEDNHPERTLVKDYFSNQPFCAIQPRKQNQEYLKELMASKFVVCPRGNGLDCHRMWESFCLGTIPVIRASPIDPLFEGLPALMIQDWREVTEAFLEKKYQEMSAKHFKLDKVYMDYWIDLIEHKKSES